MTVLLLLKRHLIYRQNQLFIFYTLYILVIYLYYPNVSLVIISYRCFTSFRHCDCTGAHDT